MDARQRDRHEAHCNVVRGGRIASTRCISKHSCDVGQHTHGSFSHLASHLTSCASSTCPPPSTPALTQGTREFKLQLAFRGISHCERSVLPLSLCPWCCGGRCECAVSGQCWQPLSCLGICRRLLAELSPLASPFAADCSLAAVHKPEKSTQVTPNAEASGWQPEQRGGEEKI